MEGGQVSQQGKYSELLGSGTAFEKLVSAHQSSITALDTSASQQNQVQGQQESDEYIVPSALQVIRQASDIDVIAKGPSAAIQLTEEEEKGIGDLGWKPYKEYINVSKGAFQFSGMCIAQVLFTCFQIASTYWLAVAVFRWVTSVLHFLLGHILDSLSSAASLPTLEAVLRLFWVSRPPKHSLAG